MFICLSEVKLSEGRNFILVTVPGLKLQSCPNKGTGDVLVAVKMLLRFCMHRAPVGLWRCVDVRLWNRSIQCSAFLPRRMWTFFFFYLFCYSSANYFDGCIRRSWGKKKQILCHSNVLFSFWIFVDGVYKHSWGLGHTFQLEYCLPILAIWYCSDKCWE